MKHPAKLLVFCLVTGLAHGGTFELADPAAEIMEEQNNPEEYAQPDDAGELARLQEEVVDEVIAGQEMTWVSEGPGKTPCSAHLSHKGDSPGSYQSGLHWVQGFVDGVAYQRLITLGDNRMKPDYDPDSLEPWIERYCIGHPPDDLALAARAFLVSLGE